MSDGTHIEWTDATWNPITGCSVVSPGCANCYAMKLAGTRLKDIPSRQGLTRASKAGPVWTGEVRLNEEWLDQPLRWRRPRRIFVCAHTDLFHEAVPDQWIDRVFAVMALAPQHQFQVLTKRSARMRDYIPRAAGRIADSIIAMRKARGDTNMVTVPLAHVRAGFSWWPLRNVWKGVSVEDQARADERIPDLLATPAAVRWISAEPLLGPIDLRRNLGGTRWIGGQRGCGGTHRHNGRPGDTIHGVFHVGDPSIPHHHHDDRCRKGLDWVVVGGESGPGARPMHPDWARSLRDQCAEAGVPFLFKQWGAWAPIDPWAPADRRPQRAIDAHGAPVNDDVAPEDVGGCRLMRVGKKAAGRLLDSVLHDGFPQGGAS